MQIKKRMERESCERAVGECQLIPCRFRWRVAVVCMGAAGVGRDDLHWRVVNEQNCCRHWEGMACLLQAEVVEQAVAMVEGRCDV